MVRVRDALAQVRARVRIEVVVRVRDALAQVRVRVRVEAMVRVRGRGRNPRMVGEQDGRITLTLPLPLPLPLTCPASTIPPGSAQRCTSARRMATSCSTPG